jgi:hypothetical protein
MPDHSSRTPSQRISVPWKVTETWSPASIERRAPPPLWPALPFWNQVPL